MDANVLIFERIREELDHGKTVRTAVDEGFRHAMSAIVDSNVSTALTAAVLYQYGTGPVRGFAVTLLAGIAASMVTSIFVVRTFYMIWLNRSQERTDTEHLMLRITSRHQLRFHPLVEWAAGITARLHRPRSRLARDQARRTTASSSPAER